MAKLTTMQKVTNMLKELNDNDCARRMPGTMRDLYHMVNYGSVEEAFTLALDTVRYVRHANKHENPYDGI